jgi:hypothetical protein
MFRYYLPQDVVSPQDCVDSVIPLFDGGTNSISAFSIARVTWQGNDCIGIRWNINEREWDDPNKKSGKIICIGEPNSRGYPTWFILPNKLLLDLLIGNSEIEDSIKTELKRLEFNL